MNLSRPDLSVRGGDVVTPDGITRVDIAIGDGTMLEISSEIGDSAPEGIVACGFLVLPGAIDVHVHVNKLGRADWGGRATSSARSRRRSPLRPW